MSATSTSKLRIKQRSVIVVLTLDGLAVTEIHRRMKAVYNDGCMDMKNVCKWVPCAKSCSKSKLDVKVKEKNVTELSRKKLLYS